MNSEVLCEVHAHLKYVKGREFDTFGTEATRLCI